MDIVNGIVGWCRAVDGVLVHYYRFYDDGRITRKLSAVDGKRALNGEFDEVSRVTGIVYLYGGDVYRWYNSDPLPRDVAERIEAMELDEAL